MKPIQESLLKSQFSNKKITYARAGIRTRVEGVTVPHTGPECMKLSTTQPLYTTRAYMDAF
jgi:hypothetical protein